MSNVAVLGPVWVALALLIIVCALLAHRSQRAFAVGCAGVAFLWVVAGAAFNATARITGENYSGFADAADIQFITNTWESLVVPRHQLFIGLLIAFQTVAGMLVLVPGRPREVALLALIAFNLALVSFGWAFVFWSLPMATALTLLVKAQRHRAEHPASHRHAPTRETFRQPQPTRSEPA